MIRIGNKSGVWLAVLRPVSAIIRQEINGEYSCEIELPAHDPAASLMTREAMLELPDANGSRQLFRISSVTRTLDSLTAFAWHISQDLAYDQIVNRGWENRTGAYVWPQFLQAGITERRFTGISDITVVNTMKVVRENMLAAAIGEMNNSFVRRYGGELRRDNYTLDMLTRLGTDNGYRVVYRKNLLGFRIVVDDSELVNRIVPTYLNDKFAAVQLPEVYIDSTKIGDTVTPHVQAIHYGDIIVGHELIDGTIPYPTVASAQAEVRARVQEIFRLGADQPRLTATVDFVELRDTVEYKDYQHLERVNIGDDVTLEYDPFEVKDRVVSYIWDCLEQRYREIKLGHVEQSLDFTIERIRKDVDSIINDTYLPPSSGGGSTEPVDVAVLPVGVEFDFSTGESARLGVSGTPTTPEDFDQLPMYGGRRRCNLTDSGIVTAYHGEAAYTETGWLRRPVVKNGQQIPAGTKVQVMVEQPKFYYRIVPTDAELLEQTYRIQILSPASASGTLTITIDGVDYPVSIEFGMQPEQICSIVAAEAYTGWTCTHETAAYGPEIANYIQFRKNAIGTISTVEIRMSAGMNITTDPEMEFEHLEVAFPPKGGRLRKARMYVCSVPQTGYKVHPAFVVDGQEVDKIYLAAYSAGVYDTSEGVYMPRMGPDYDAGITYPTPDLAIDYLCSVAGTEPFGGTYNTTRAIARANAQRRGPGWNLGTVQARMASILLAVIEYETYDLKAAIGPGLFCDRVFPLATGQTSALGNKTGEGPLVYHEYSDRSDAAISYRGEENLWGQMYRAVEGLNIYVDATESRVYVSDHDFAEDQATLPYKHTGFSLPRFNGYVTALSYSPEFDWLMLPAETTWPGPTAINDQADVRTSFPGWKNLNWGYYDDTPEEVGPFTIYGGSRSSTDTMPETSYQLMYIPT